LSKSFKRPAASDELKTAAIFTCPVLLYFIDILA